MHLFERDIEIILEDLKSIDFDVRRQAIGDLVVSSYKDKISVLGNLCKSEQDIQLKYEIRKAINELESVESNYKPSSSESSFKNLRKAFRSSDEKIVSAAFKYVVENRLEDFLPEMMMIENYTRDPYQRTYIIRLMHYSDTNYFTEIINYLHDEDSRVVSTAIELLEEAGNTTALASIVRLTEHSNNRVRAAAIKALHNLGNEKSLQLFIKMIQSSHSAYRDSAAFTLSQMCIPEGVKLLSMLLVDEVRGIRLKALQGLERMADAGDLEALDLTHRLRNEKPYGLWADKLIELMDKSRYREEKIRLSDNLLQNPNLTSVAALYADSNKLRITAIETIIKTKSKSECAETIIQRLKSEKNSRVISSAILALGKAGGSTQLKTKILKSYLDNSDDRVRANAIEALIRITVPHDRDFIIDSLQDSNNRVIGNAIVALWENKLKQSKEALKKLIKSPLQTDQSTAVYCIGELADWKLAEFCNDLLISPHTKVREQMERTLVHLHDISAFANVLKNWKINHKELDLENL